MDNQIENTSNDAEAAINAGVMIGAIKPTGDENNPIAGIVVLPGDATAIDVMRPTLPFRHKGIVRLTTLSSFLEYMKRYKFDEDANVYGQTDPAMFTAILNDHHRGIDQTQNWRDFGCSYAPKFSREYQAWTGRNKHRFEGNEEFANWLEDNLTDVIRPESGRLLEIALNFKVNSNLSFSNPVRLQNGNTELNYQNSVEGSTTVTGQGKISIPDTFAIAVPVFDGPDAVTYEFEARFRYRLVQSRLSIWYELIRPHKVVDGAFNDMVEHIEKAIDEPVLYGSSIAT